MALSVVQGAVAAAMSSGGVGGGLGSHSPKPSYSPPSEFNLALIHKFNRFVNEGGPNNMDTFISSLIASDSPSRDRRGLSPGAEKRAREARDHLDAQMKKMITSAGEPLLFQVTYSCALQIFSQLSIFQNDAPGDGADMGWNDDGPNYSAAYTVSILLILILILMIFVLAFLFPSSRPGSTYYCATLTLWPKTFLICGLALSRTQPLTR